MVRIGSSMLFALCLAGGLITCLATFVPAVRDPDRSSGSSRERSFHSSAGGQPYPAKSRERKKIARAGLDLQAVERALHLASESESDEELSAIIKTLSKAEALEVIRYLQGPGKPGSPKEEKIGSFVRAWAGLDPDAALTWAAQLPEWERDSMVEAVCISAAVTDPLKAIEAAREFRDPARESGIVENIADHWAARDLPGVTRWARKLPKEGNRDQIIARIAFVQSMSDPIAAANLILAEIPQGEIQDEAAMTVIHQWALKNPAEARAWVNAFPASSLQTRAMAELDGITAARQSGQED